MADRAQIDRFWNRAPLLGFVAIQTMSATATQVEHERWISGAAVLLVTLALAWCAWSTFRARPLRRLHAWEAEWYAAQRLGPAS